MFQGNLSSRLAKHEMGGQQDLLSAWPLPYLPQRQLNREPAKFRLLLLDMGETEQLRIKGIAVMVKAYYRDIFGNASVQTLKGQAGKQGDIVFRHYARRDLGMLAEEADELLDVFFLLGLRRTGKSGFEIAQEELLVQRNACTGVGQLPSPSP